MQRPKEGGEWIPWMGKVYTEKDRAELQLAKQRESEAFFRWGREYTLQRQPINAEWEEVDG